jgi:hypothetical protein
MRPPLTDEFDVKFSDSFLSHWEMAKFLITNFRPNSSNTFYFDGINSYRGTSLHYALTDPNITTDTIDFFINQVGIDVNIVSDPICGSYSALGVAVQYNNIPMIKYLIERYGADVHYKTPRSEYSLIHIAAYSEHSTMELFEYLLTLGIDTHIDKFNDGSESDGSESDGSESDGSESDGSESDAKNSILNLAADHQPLEIIKLLIQQSDLGVNLIRHEFYDGKRVNDDEGCQRAYICTLSQATLNPDPTVLDYLIDITDFQHFYQLYNKIPKQSLSDFKQRHIKKLLPQAVEHANLPVVELLMGDKYQLYIKPLRRHGKKKNLLDFCLQDSHVEVKTSQVFRYLVGLNLFYLNEKRKTSYLYLAVQNPSLTLDDIKFLCTRPGVNVHQVDGQGQNICHMVNPNRKDGDELFGYFISMLFFSHSFKCCDYF